MLNANIILLALFSISRAAFSQAGAPAVDVRIPKLVNTINQCVAVSLKEVQQTQFGTFVTAKLTNKQFGKCGCKSAEFSYSVVEIYSSPPPPKGVEPAELTSIYVTFTPFKPSAESGSVKEFAFMLQAADGHQRTKNKTELRLSCAPSP